MFDLKPIAKDAIPRALAKAERYRFLNEPREAESISRDVLSVDPDHEDGLISLILALTDRFVGMQIKPDEARQLAARLKSEYDRVYYAGVIEERWAKALLDADYPHDVVFRILRAALEHFDTADRLAPPANDDATLRWNSCVRIIRQHDMASSGSGHSDDSDAFEDDVPLR